MIIELTMKKFLILIRKILAPFVKIVKLQELTYQLKGQEASDYIKELLNSDRPVMISRFGSVELGCLVDYKNKYNINNVFKFIFHKIDTLGYGKSTRFTMSNNAGFFPVNSHNLTRFSKLMIKSMQFVDVLGSWIPQEILFEDELKNAIKVPLDNLEPYIHLNPWSEVLKGKNVLIIHPFEDSIKDQYKKRNDLFKDKRVLPDFKIDTLKAIQSIANNPCGFETWFEALEFMKKEIDNRDFEIAIIGCGAYGFLLAAYIKSIGKKAIHLGGATQMLFGIKSKSWEEQAQLKVYINKYWVNPKNSERPLNFENVENGRYW